MMKKSVYVSHLLKDKFPSVIKNIGKILEKYNYNLKEIRDTNDIWCRDYMPVRAYGGELVRFTYKPSYLQSSEANIKSITNIDEILSWGKWTYRKTDIILDGGAIEIYQDKGIISDRVFSENPGVAPEQLIMDIKRLLELNTLTIVPAHPDDPFGHVDGLVRFIDRDTVLINDFTREYRKNWVLKFQASLINAGYVTESLPYRAHDNKGDDAEGIYANFLKLPNLIIVPSYTFSKEDKHAAELLARLYPGRAVESVYATDLAKKGGIINCVTWSRD